MMTTKPTELDTQELREHFGVWFQPLSVTISGDYGDETHVRDMTWVMFKALIAQREQAAELRGRIDELEQLPPHTTKLGYSYLVDRWNELNGQATKPEKGK